MKNKIINEEDNLPDGIYIRHYSSGKKAIRIFFSYKGVKCKETLKNMEPTKNNIKYAARLRGEILNEITRNTFNYSEHFPLSKRANLFGHNTKRVLLKKLLEDYIALAEKTTELSTYRSYARSINTYLIPTLGSIPIGELQTKHVRDMIKGWKKYDKVKKQYVPLKAKSVRNMLIPLSNVIAEALTDDLIKVNPLKGIVLSKILPKESFKSDYVVDPFDQEEVNKIINALQGSMRNMIQLWFFTGLRPSELMALEWQDVNFIKGTMHIDRAMVLKRLKDPKTKSGKRYVMLLPPALEALKQQKSHTYLLNQRIFLNPGTSQPWVHDHQLRDWWRIVLRKAGVNYRNPYQCRHTYASTMLSNGENMMWVANQLGHVDTEMVTKIYGKWIPDGMLSTGYKCKNNWGDFLDQNILDSKQPKSA